MGRILKWFFGSSSWRRAIVAFIFYLGGIPWLIIGIIVLVLKEKIEDETFLTLEPLNPESELDYVVFGSVFVFAGIIFWISAIYFTYRVLYIKKNRSAEFYRPLIQDRKAFLKFYVFICENCKKFTDKFRENCEYCGTEDSLRKATKLDFKQYVEKEQIRNKDQLKKQLKLKEVIKDTSELKNEALNTISSTSDEKVKLVENRESFLKAYPYICVNCNNFTNKLAPDGPQKPCYFYHISYCEICESSDSLRVATKKDFKQFIRKKR